MNIKNALILAAYISITLVRFAAEYGPSQRTMDLVHPVPIFGISVCQIVFALTSLSVVALWIYTIAKSSKFPFLWIIPALIPFAVTQELADKMNGTAPDYLANIGEYSLGFGIFTAIVYGVVALIRWLQSRSKQPKLQASTAVGNAAQMWPPPPTSSD